VRLAGGEHASHDGPRHHITRCKIGERMLVHHEVQAFAIAQDCAFTAHGLTDQWLLTRRGRAQPQHRGVELHELHIGDLRSRTNRQGKTIAGRHRGIRRLRIHLTEASGRENDHRGECRSDSVALTLAHDMQRHSLNATLDISQQIERERTLDEFDALIGEYGGDERATDLRTRRIPSGMGDAITQVAAFTGEFQFPGFVDIEGRTEFDQMPHRIGAFGHQRAHRIDIAQSGTGDEGVVQVFLGGVVLGERGSDAALRPPCRAFIDSTLRHDEHAQARSPRIECGGQAGDPGSDDHDIGADLPGRLRCFEPTHALFPSSSAALSIRRVPATGTATSSRAAPRSGAGPRSGSVTAT